MERFTGLFFHTLSGTNGWSFYGTNNLDIAKVLSISYKKRAFCLFNRDRPFSLYLTYNEPGFGITLLPIFGGLGAKWLFYPHWNPTKTITKRYKTEEECKAELSKIQMEKQKIFTRLSKEKKCLETEYEEWTKDD
jgi:hypothetical protein